MSKKLGSSVYELPVSYEVTRTTIRILDAKEFLICEFGLDCVKIKQAQLAAIEIVRLINDGYHA